MIFNITSYFEKTITLYHDKVAVVTKEGSINFSDLDKKAKIIANYFNNEKIIRTPIAVYLPKSIDSISSDLGIIYSGNYYMNLDIETPISRIKNILEKIKPEFIITNNVYFDKLTGTSTEISIVNIDEIDYSRPIDNKLLKNYLSKIIDTDPLCIINTSGSTGTPKGVVLNHKSFIDFTERALETLNFGDNEIIGSLSPLVFDIYSFELCMLMANGSTIVLIPDSFATFPITLLKWIKETKVTFIFWVPTIMVNIANMNLLSKIDLPDLKTIWFAGEVFPTKQFNYWKEHIKGARFINLYGPIEITLDCTYFIVDRELQDNEPIPIGFPFPNTDILILNSDNKLADTDEEGELCVRGTSLAMGYYNDPEKTSNVFVQNPLNDSFPEIIYRTGDIVYKNKSGEIIFKGRKDSLVKHMGYRVELGEIEHVIINTLKLIENGCVVYNFQKKEITLFYESQNEIIVAQLRKTLGEVLPKYMIPSAYIRLNEMPMNTNGKIDRLYLKNKINNEEN
jgi:amino acid adenylation domain-containing protein